MTKDLTLTTTDLASAGINAQLSSNDLVEVVAHDIYDKYLDAINDIISKGHTIENNYQKLMTPEIEKIRKSLSRYFLKEKSISVVDDDDFADSEEESSEMVVSSFGTADDYWPAVQIIKLTIAEKERGTFVSYNQRSLQLPNLKSKTPKVKLQITNGTNTSVKEVKQGDIAGTIKTTTTASFYQIVTVPISRFKDYANEVIEHNKQVKDLLLFLPKNGLLSVDRFTREARVKMNKKIISAQSDGFKKKISELFNIKL